MSKNAKIQKAKIFGKNSCPGPKSKHRDQHMRLIQNWVFKRLNVESGVTPGKINAKGQLIDKPNWDNETITWENNPDAAVHELGHVFLMPIETSLKQHDAEMRAQFGQVIRQFGFMQQKRSIFEIMPMGMEQKIRRRMGLPANRSHIVVESGAPPRLELETGRPCANRVKTKTGKTIDLIRCSKNLDFGALERLKQIDNGELVFKPGVGWTESQSIDAKINRRARLANRSKVSSLRAIA